MTEHTCVNEDRLLKLELYAKQRAERIESLEEKLTNLDTNIQNLCIELTHINSILSTLKWVISILIALFGGILVFIVTELIKAI
jgi:hypothetical protein